MNLCKYKNIFGEPYKGVHSYRFFGLALVDLLGTLGVSMLIAYIFSVDLTKTFIILFLIGMLCHCLFCVKTPLNCV